MTRGARHCAKIIAAVVAALAAAGLLFYFFSDGIKKAFLSRLSDGITGMAGQRVAIGDVSVGMDAGITFHSIQIANPEGFEAGALLTIERVLLSFDLSELLSGRLSLHKVEILSPQLRLSKNKEGRTNVSDELRRFLTTKSRVGYRIDALAIECGSAVLVNEATHQLDHVKLTLMNLSSEKGTKTVVTGSARYGQGSISVDGWAYLRDDPTKFALSLSVKDAVLPRLAAVYEGVRTEAEQVALALDLHAEGDTAQSIALTTQVRVVSGGRLPFMKGVTKGIRFDGRASYHISDETLTIHEVRMYAGDVVGGGLRGVITEVRGTPRYSVDIKIERLDISAVAMPEGMSAGGIASSDAIHVEGTLGRGRPHAKGAIVLTDASLRAQTVDLTHLNAKISLDAGRELSLSAEATSKVAKVGEYALHEPSDLVVSLYASGEAAAMTVAASLELSAVKVNLDENNEARVGQIHMETKGTLKGHAYVGEAALKMGSLRYAGYGAVNADAAFAVEHSPGETRLKDIILDAESVRSSVSRIAIRRSDKGAAWALEANGLNVRDPLRKIEIGDADFSLSVNVHDKEVSGGFSMATATVHDVRSQGISGSARFGQGRFSIAIPRAEIGGGRLRVAAEGRTSDGPFPVSADIAAEDVDAGYLSKAVSSLVRIPYSAAGSIERIAFRGTIDSLDSLYGNASLEGRNMTVLKNEKGSVIARDASLTMETVFKGRDLEFDAEATIGPVSATAAGLARDFARRERVVTIRASLPEVRIADIRASFWDLFPDSLLYLGLEGSLSSDITVKLEETRLSGQGELRFKDIRIEGENGEYSVGPVNGIIPVLYSGVVEGGRQVSVPPHMRPEIESVRAHYSGEFTGEGYGKVSLGSFRYGFPLLDEVTVWVKQRGSLLEIGRLAAHVFGGRLHASGVVDITDGPGYRIGILLEGMSLNKLCERIEPIRGYLSGNVDGIGTFRGYGPNLAQITGVADFWTYRTKDEATKVSREFLQKLGGPSMKAYLGDRPFDKGIMSILVKDGYVLFRELEISNRNFLGVQDLSVKVAPLNNRIAIDHLLWSLAEAGERAQKK